MPIRSRLKVLCLPALLAALAVKALPALAVPVPRGTGDVLDRAYQAAQTLASEFASSREEGASSHPTQVVLFHTNDIHGYIAPQKADPRRGWPDTGGAASLATVLRSESRPFLWLDSGDWYQGTPEGTLTRGDAVIDIFNALGLTAAVLGNHDFDHGVSNVERMLVGKARFQVLGTNITTAGGRPPPYIADTLIQEPVPGLKIGFFGLLTSDMPNLVAAKKTSGLSFGAEADAARDAVTRLRQQGTHIIVAVTHIGAEADQALARQVSGIDIILGGHTHTHMDQPLIVAGPHGGRTLITQTSGWLRTVYRLVLDVDAARGRLLHAEAGPVVLAAAHYPPDPAAARLVEASQGLAEQRMGEVIGSAAVGLRRGQGESLLGNWITDVMRRTSGADIAAMNTFGIRADLPSGPLTYRDLFLVCPFDDNLVEVRLTGSTLREAVKRSLASGRDALQWSGLRIVHDRAGRVVSLEFQGAPIDDDRTYALLTVEYVATVSEVFKSLEVAISPPQELILRDLLEREIRSNSPISAALDGRLQLTQ